MLFRSLACVLPYLEGAEDGERCEVALPAPLATEAEERQLTEDCRMFGVVGDVPARASSLTVPCMWPDEDAGTRPWMCEGNKLPVTERGVDVHDRAFAATTRVDVETLLDEAEAGWRVVPDMWGNTPLHYLAMRAASCGAFDLVERAARVGGDAVPQIGRAHV